MKYTMQIISYYASPLIISYLLTCESFTLNGQMALKGLSFKTEKTTFLFQSAAPSDVEDPTSLFDDPTSKRIDDLKNDLIDLCERDDITDKNFEVSKLVTEVEKTGKEMNIGQDSSSSGLLSGKWKLVYASEDVTRSSPFFWAFRKAYGSDISSQIFAITDAIPSPLKDVGPAMQEISFDNDKSPGTLVSQVEVATLQGMATSLMTTRCTILGSEDNDTIRVRVDTTKPEDWTLLKKLGPLGEAIEQNAPPFPSGQALEKVVKGSSEVLLQNTFTDENMRISRNKEGNEDFYIWIRDGFLGDFEI